MGKANGSKTKVYACLSRVIFSFLSLVNGCCKSLNCVSAISNISGFEKLCLQWCRILLILFGQNESPEFGHKAKF